MGTTSGRYRVKGLEKGKLPEEEAIERVRRVSVADSILGREEMPADVKRLRKELHEARLYNKLLDAMIDIAEEQMGVSIRKKSGAKQ